MGRRIKEMATSPLAPNDPNSPSPATVRRPSRRRSTGSNCSSISSASSSSSSILSSPSPCSHYFHSSTIPFSWEKLPGIPKFPSKSPNPHSNPLLPLPPPLRSAPFPSSTPKKNRIEDKFILDPFAVALVECAKDPPASAGDGGLDEFLRKRAAIGGRWWSIGDRFGIVDLYGSCKASCSVSESTISIPRAGNRTGSYRILNRRSG